MWKTKDEFFFPKDHFLLRVIRKKSLTEDPEVDVDGCFLCGPDHPQVDAGLSFNDNSDIVTLIDSKGHAEMGGWLVSQPTW